MSLSHLVPCVASGTIDPGHITEAVGIQDEAEWVRVSHEFMIVMIVMLLVMMVVVMIAMYLYISSLCWSSGSQVKDSMCMHVHHFGIAILPILNPDSRGKTWAQLKGEFLEFWSLTKAQIAQAIAKVGGGWAKDDYRSTRSLH